MTVVGAATQQLEQVIRGRATTREIKKNAIEAEEAIENLADMDPVLNPTKTKVSTHRKLEACEKGRTSCVWAESSRHRQ